MSDESLTDLKRVGPKMAAKLTSHGYETKRDVLEADPDDLTAIDGIGPKTSRIMVGEREDTVGRPTKFNDDRARQACDAARKGKSKSGCARAAEVDLATLLLWLQKNPMFTDNSGVKVEFSTAFTRARTVGENRLIDGGLDDPNVDSSFAKFLLKTSFDYQEVQKHDMRIDDDAEIPDPNEDAKKHIDALVNDEPET